jgi:anti-sigma B factor antagonist
VTAYQTKLPEPEDDLPPGDVEPGTPEPPRAPIPLFLSVREEPGVTVVAVSGELDLLTAPRLMSELEDIVLRPTGDTVVDLTETTFIDSVGIHVLMSAHARLARQSRNLAVICGNSPARRTLELMSLTEVLSLVDTYEDYERRRASR